MHIDDPSSLAVSRTHFIIISWPDPLDAVSPSKGAVCHAYILRERTARRQRSLPPCDPTSWNADSEHALTPSVPLPRAELLHVLMLPDFERADRIC
jgi:hypothetical protein